MRIKFFQYIIDIIRLKPLKSRLYVYLNNNPNAIRFVINILSLYKPKGVCIAKNRFLQFAGVKMGGGNNVHISGNITLHNACNLEMGEHTSLGQNTVLYCWDKVRIGKYTFMGPNNVFVAGGHKKDTFESDVKPINIGKGCWIGANITFLGGCEVGNGCIVGAGSVVIARKYPPFSIIAGVPARVIGKRECPSEMKIPVEYNISELLEEQTDT